MAGVRIKLIPWIAIVLLGMGCTAAETGSAKRKTVVETGGAEINMDHPYVGMWVTEDRQIRHELLPNSRYVEARGNRERAYEGRYKITGNYIEYWDDTGFTADGEFRNDILYHAGMILYRR